MQSVRLHVAGDGAVWALSKCSVCWEVDKHALATAAAGTVRCRKCGHMMDIAGAVVEAVNAEVARSTGSRLAAVAPGLEDVLEASGLTGAVAEINRTAPHRYTGIFVKDGPMLRNLALCDKQDPDPALWAPFPLGQSFCSIIIGAGDPLTIRQAATDTRSDVTQHPAGQVVQAYCGVPITDEAGQVLGTLCHFDPESVSATVDLVAMLQFSPLLLQYLPGQNGEATAIPRVPSA